MIAPALLCLLATLGLSNAAQTLETAEFNVTDGLLQLGVDPNQLPDVPPSDHVERSSGFACSAACTSLSLIFGQKRVLSEGCASYDSFTGGYWSTLQADVDPRCIFMATKATDVSVAVLLARLTQCPFAVKSGGHAAFAGASSIEGGITVSLDKMTEITVSSDKKTALIRPGNDWGDVYKVLDKSEVTVTGGRVARVGTGGLTLGGGISYFSNIYGWACDNVLDYEVVTANGAIVHASQNSHPDLYWALRGGGNNFGVVTGFKFETIPVPGAKMWGGTKTNTENDFPAVVDAFASAIENSPKDPNAGLWVAWLVNSGLKLAATELYYAKPDGSKAAIFDGFNALTPVADTTQTRVLAEYAEHLQESNPYGLREVYYAITVKADARIAAIAKDIFFEELPTTANVSGANPVMIYQGITVGQQKAMEKRGGNPLGLNYRDGPLYLIHMACWWEKAADDETVYAFTSKVLERVEAQAKKLGVQNDYIYMNYGSMFEDVIAQYGPANVRKLKTIARKYDPTGVFQTLQPGGFKLDRAPVPNSGYFSGLRS